jgi:hypothetical protein
VIFFLPLAWAIPFSAATIDIFRYCQPVHRPTLDVLPSS